MSDFKGFRFGNIHIKDLHLTVVSAGDRFNKNLLPDPTDYTVDVPGGNGKYYFGQTHGARVYPVKTAFDNLDEYTIRKIRQIFVTDKPKDLVFDEEPYKVYRAKLNSAPQFNYVCFLDKETNQRVYKGECDFNFIMYHPYAFCFNKYIVTAADFYKCTPPELIIHPSEDTYKLNNNAAPPLPKTVKEHFNIAGNMDTPWKGGYPTIEQVQHGELFYKDPEHPDQKSSIVEVKHYWDNVPRWQVAARLLTSPTLDYEHELMYMPQYHQAQYCNLDMGIHTKNFALGNRLLVYNSGDLSIDFNLTLGNLANNFRGRESYTFRVSRFNVQRLTIEQAVDWLGLKTFDVDDETEYKYGNKYFKHKVINTQEQKFDYDDLGDSHPRHCYIAEPIPQEDLAFFIRLFYKQSNLLLHKNFSDNTNTHFFNHEQGEKYAEEYEEKRAMCVTDDERNELYWEYLKKAILERYNEYNDQVEEQYKLFKENDYTYEDFVYDFIFHPQEYIRQTDDLNYGEFNFNIARLPQYYTYDYLDINNNNFDKILYKDCGCETEEQELSRSGRNSITSLILDSEARMLYNNQEDRTWEAGNEELEKNFYKINSTKIVFNDNIEKGRWFQLPPGWSLVDISPVVDEDTWGGKTWQDSRAFNWGTSDNTQRQGFDDVYYPTIELFLNTYYPNKIPSPQPSSDEEWEALINFREWADIDKIPDFPESYVDHTIDTVDIKDYICYSIKKFRIEKAELQFLKMLNDQFQARGIDISTWWWDANNYMWANFPPIYWSYVDLINRGHIDYIPQYY